MDAGERSRDVVMPSRIVITPANPRRPLHKAAAKAPIPDVKERRRPSHEPCWPIRPRDGVRFCGREGGDRGGWGGTWDATRDWCGVMQEACSFFVDFLATHSFQTHRGREMTNCPRGPRETSRCHLYALDSIPSYCSGHCPPSARPCLAAALSSAKKGTRSKASLAFHLPVLINMPLFFSSASGVTMSTSISTGAGLIST